MESSTNTTSFDSSSCMTNTEMYGWIFVTFLMIFFMLPHLPNKRSSIRYHARFLFYHTLVSFVTLIHFPLYIIRFRDTRNCLTNASILKYIANILGITYELRNEEILRENNGCVVILNHQSTLDVLGMFNHWHHFGKCAPIAKKELFYVWPFGLCAYLCGVVFIDRSNKKAALKTFEITTDVMINKKYNIWIFPEGTRNTKHDGNLLEFKKGAFYTAVNAQVPIVPIVFSPYYFIDAKTNFFDSTGRIIITALDPVPTKGLTEKDVPELMKMVKNKMSETLREVHKEVTEHLPDDYPNCVE